MEVFYVSCLVQTDATLLANNPQHCWMLHVASVCTPCCLLLHVVACCSAKFETVQNFEPTTPKISFFCDRRSVAQQCWIRLHSSYNIVGATHAHYTWSPKSYGLYPSHDALQVPTVSGVVCTPLTNTVTTTPNIVGRTILGVVCYTAVFSVVTQRSFPLTAAENRTTFLSLCVCGLTNKTIMYKKFDNT